MEKHRNIIFYLFIVIILFISFLDFQTTKGATENILADMRVVINNLRFWQREEINITNKESEIKEEQNIKSPESYESLIQFEEAIINAVDKVTKGVVSIVVTKDVPVLERCPITDPFFGPGFRFYIPCETGRTENVEIGGGTGFFVSSNGLVLTNMHVVADKDAEYTVFISDDSRYTARVVATDSKNDLALLKVEGENFSYLTLGNSDRIRLGQTAIAIGNALGEYQDTVSVGVISGLNRAITAVDRTRNRKTIEGAIQTDAAINPGNSGGPLINLRGEVIGINTAMVFNAENIGFSVPINKAIALIQATNIQTQ